MYFRLDNPDLVAPVFWILSDTQRGRPQWPATRRDWTVMADYIETNGLASVVLRKTGAMGVNLPANVAERLERIDETVTLAAGEAERWRARIAAAIEAEGIPQYWLKGIAWGKALYAGQGVRPMRDLDLIVPAADVLRADAIVSDLGFTTDASSGVAAQHLPRRVHAESRIKLDIHHRLLPRRIYGFPVAELEVPWNPGKGIIGDNGASEDHRFHVAHMVTHIFHHSFYNLRLLHLFDVRLARDAWGLSSEEIIELAARSIPRAIATDIIALVDALFGAADGGSPADLRRRWIRAFQQRGSMALGYPLTRIPRWRDVPPVTRAELRRMCFVLFESPGRFGRARAALHPPA